jgi:hypothetical protein
MQVRVYYDGASGRVARIEHRPDEDYTDANADRGDGTSTLVVDGTGLEGIAFEDLEVKGGKLERHARPEAVAEVITDAGENGAGAEVTVVPNKDQERIDEIRRMDKSDLSDEEWLKLYREYLSLTGGF